MTVRDFRINAATESGVSRGTSGSFGRDGSLTVRDFGVDAATQSSVSGLTIADFGVNTTTQSNVSSSTGRSFRRDVISQTLFSILSAGDFVSEVISHSLFSSGSTSGFVAQTGVDFVDCSNKRGLIRGVQAAQIANLAVDLTFNGGNTAVQSGVSVGTGLSFCSNGSSTGSGFISDVVGQTSFSGGSTGGFGVQIALNVTNHAFQNIDDVRVAFQRVGEFLDGVKDSRRNTTEKVGLGLVNLGIKSGFSGESAGDFVSQIRGDCAFSSSSAGFFSSDSGLDISQLGGSRFSVLDGADNDSAGAVQSRVTHNLVGRVKPQAASTNRYRIRRQDFEVQVLNIGISSKGNAMKNGEVSHVFLQETLYRKVFSTRLWYCWRFIPQTALKLEALGPPEEHHYQRA